MEAEPKAEPPKRKRRWYQFSLRTLMIFTLIVAIPCAWIGRRLERKRKEREAIKAIETLGGHVWYDYESQSGVEGARTEPFGPAFLRRLLGDDVFSEVSRVAFQGGIKDADLENVIVFPDLQTLSLDFSHVTDSGLARLTMLSRLRSLSLGRSQITDAGLVHLREFAELQRLEMIFAPVTDSGLAALKPLTRLQRLDLSGTQIRDAGLVNLRDMTELEELDLLLTKVDDSSIPDLKRLKHLRQLNLASTGVTEAGVKALQTALPNCQVSPIGHWLGDLLAPPRDPLRITEPPRLKSSNSR